VTHKSNGAGHPVTDAGAREENQATRFDKPAKAEIQAPVDQLAAESDPLR
jgi:hypothetical protein